MPLSGYSSCVRNPRTTLIRRHPIVSYFLLTFAISWTGALLLAAPHLLRHEPLPKITGILMFPAMLLGPSLACVLLTKVFNGKSGLRDLFARMSPQGVHSRWYTSLLIAPALVLAVLLCLEKLVSPMYAPNHFLIGILFGIPAGFLEEIGWTGFAFPEWPL